MQENNEMIQANGVITWQEMIVDIAQLRPYERNPRKISPEDYARLKQSIQALGQFAPLIVTRDMRVASGHQRLKAFCELGWDKVRVSVPSRDLTDDEFRQVLIRANVANGQYDIDMLKLDFTTMEMEDWGVDGATIRQMGVVVTPSNADDVPAIGSAAVTRLGDTWLLGDHRLRCGDATNASDVATLLGGAVPHLMVTDPPYGVEYDADFRNGIRREDGSIVSARAIGKVMNDDRCDWREAYALFPGEVAYVWHASLHSHEFAISLIACDFELRANIIWAKNQIAIGRGHYHWQHEPCWYAVRSGGTGHWNGDRKQSTVWNIDKPSKSETGHSTQKPVECMKRPIENNSSVGDSVYDPFSGSGTTIIAAQITGRKCYAMELNPLYCDMGVARWEAFTGQKAVLWNKIIDHTS